MKFYKRYVGDVMKKTAGLTMAQFGAYDRLMDWCYANETPIDPTEANNICGAHSAAERRDVQKVLAKFFVLTEAGYTQQRIEEELAAALPKIEAARANGALGGRPRKTDEKPTGFSDGTERTPKSEPKAKAIQEPEPEPENTDPIGSGAPGATPVVPVPLNPRPQLDANEIIFGYGVPILINAGNTDKNARAFLGRLRKMHGDQAVINSLRDCLREKPLAPLEWLAAALPPHAQKGAGRQTALEARNAAVVAQLLKDDE